MFGFFKKKGEQPEEKTRAQQENTRFREFAAQFQPEELSILAVTGASGFAGSSRDTGETLWPAAVGLTAWMEEDSPDIHRGEFVLSAIADDQLLEVLRRRTPRDFIIKFRGRVSEDGQRLLLLDLPEPGFDPDLKAILEAQKKPVTLEAEGLGVFELNRQVGWFETEIDWLETPVTLSFDQEGEEAMKKSQDTARALLVGAANWDQRVRAYAAEELLDLAEGDEALFTERMELEAIQVDCWGGYGFWFSDSDGRSVHITGDLEHGPHDADLEG